MSSTRALVRSPAPILLVLGSYFSAYGARLRTFNGNIAKHSEEEPPPLEGCEDNYWNPVCCCFVDYGILKQERCVCASSLESCEGKAQLEYRETPSRPIDSDSSAKEWHTYMGFKSGYQAVGPEFCKAAPVSGPQVDGYERAYECACSNSMSQIYEMACGSSCDVENCQRGNEFKIDWKPFEEGRGTCCLSSFASSTGGCFDAVEPITVDRASIILRDAVNHAFLDHTHAFVPLTSEHLMQEMTKSFESAIEKKMSTSRSGAQFFFSGDYKYILKSIHRPEYDALKKITHHLPGKKSLVDHIRLAAETSKHLASAGFCDHLRITWSPKGAACNGRGATACRLAGLISPEFFGVWFFDSSKFRTQDGQRKIGYTFLHAQFRAYFCSKVDEWRISPNFWEKWETIGDCDRRGTDPLYENLVARRGDAEASMQDVDEEYADFMHAFEPRDKPNIVSELKILDAKCEKIWQPASLINEFAIAFEYRSSTWMVVKNSVASIQDQLLEAGFATFYKENDLFDVKPFPIHSDEREKLFKMQFVKDGMAQWRNWESMKTNVMNDVAFMDKVLDNPMVDYSLLVSVFYIKSERMVLDSLTLPNCVEKALGSIQTMPGNDYGDAEGSILVCFSIIDMLMEFTVSKTPENAILFNKWSDWSSKMITMLECLGFRSAEIKQCYQYKPLRSKFYGVDITSIPTALIQDVTHFFNAESEAMISTSTMPRAEQSQWNGTETLRTLKCCCRSSEFGAGKCILKDASGKSASWLSGNPRGCGALVGSGWHSFWREAGSCRVSPKEAARLREHGLERM